MYRRQFHLGLVIFSLIAASLACNFLASTAKTANVRLARDEKGEQTTTAFDPTDTFYMLGDLNNAPSDTKVKTIWTGVDVKDNPPNSAIGEKELVTGSGTFTFSLENKDHLWPAGTYRVDLYLNDKLDQTIDFQVVQSTQAIAQATPEISPQATTEASPQATTEASPQATIEATPQATDQTTPQPQGAAYYDNTRLARDQEGTDPTTVFSPDESFYLVSTLTGAPDAGAQVKVVWTAVKIEGSTSENQVIDTYDESLPNGGFWVSLVSNSGTWPAGQYKVELLLDGTSVDTLNFIVSKTRLDKIYMAYDQDGKRPTKVFGTQDMFYLEFDLVDAPADTKINTKWYLLDDQGSPSKTINEGDYNFGTGSYYVSLKSDSGTWQTGKYKVDIFLNNSFYTTVTFEVQ